jgi:phosphoserine phosphatase
MQLLNKEEGVFGEQDEGIATALGAQCAVALQRARMLEDLVAKEKMERELAVARDIQMRVLPKKVPELPGYDVAGWSRPADETGGDIFDIIAIDGRRLMLLLGDATGHGIGPALSVVQVRSMLRMCVRLGAGLDEAFRNINDQLSDDLASNRFVTAFLGVLDVETHRVAYHAGGQGPILHFHASDGTCEWLKASTMPMGLMAGPPLDTPAPRELARGDVLAMITDGVYEYENASGEQFGEQRLGELVRGSDGESMARLGERIVARVTEFAAGAPQKDDMTLLLLRRL